MAAAAKAKALVTIPLNDWANRIFAWCLSLTALVLSCLAASSCRFARVTTLNSAGGTYSVNLGGLYQFYDTGTGQCVSYSLPLAAADPTDPNRLIISGSHKAAQAFAIIAALLAGAAMFLLLTPLLRTLTKGAWHTAGGLLGAAALFQTLTFLIFNDDQCKTQEAFPDGGGAVRCSTDKGSNFAIAMIVVSLLATITVCRTPPPEEEALLSFRSDDDDSDTEGSRRGTAAVATGAVLSGGPADDAFENERREEEHHPQYHHAGTPHSSAAPGAAQFQQHAAPKGDPPPPSQQWQQQQPEVAPGVRRTVTETINPDGSKTVFVTTTMDDGGSADPAAPPPPPPTASSTASSFDADYARGGGSRDDRRLGPVGEAGEV